ncbi:MAG TPA: histidine kinase [Actinomycetota bacterium]
MDEERGRRTPRIAVGLWVATAIVAAGGAVLTVVAWGELDPSDRYTNLVGTVAAVVYATLGLVILRRVRNLIGWFLLGEGLAQGLVYLMSAYAVVGVLAHPGSLPAPKVVGAVSEWLFIPVFVGIVAVLLIFPTGTLPSRRWRPVAVATLALTGLSMVGFIVAPRMVALPAPGGVTLRYPNPFAIGSIGPGLADALLGNIQSLTLVSVLLLAAGLVALVVRFRTGTPELRQQIKWLAFMAGVFVLTQLGLAVAMAGCGNCAQSPATTVIGFVSAAIALFGLPIAITVAILRYGLYEIDVIINRAVVYGLLAAVLTAVYVAVVVGIGSLLGYAGGPALTIAAAAAIALLFQPLRRQAQRLANRLVYGERATPYQVLAEFAESMAGTLTLDETLDRMVHVLADGTGATAVEVRIRVGSELRVLATWPDAEPAAPIALRGADDLPTFPDATRVMAVRQRDELLGSIALRKPPNEPLTVAEDKLLQDLASQAGLVLRNARLTAQLQAKIEELRASRRRLVGAQDAERRRLERNLHDGAQQQLVALAVQLGLLERLAADPEAVSRTTRGLRAAVQEAIDDLRDLARGIYPPLLADQGLAVALATQARKAMVPTIVEATGVPRYPQEIEAAVYFCTLEAMQNVAKYAEASSVVIRVARDDGALVFEIADDGRGFDPAERSYGTGLQGMADRLDAIGGTLEIESAPGNGTTIRGLITASPGDEPGTPRTAEGPRTEARATGSGPVEGPDGRPEGANDGRNGAASGRSGAVRHPSTPS